MTDSNSPTRMIGYCRVSTKDQAEGGVSLDAQRRSIELWATAGGHEIVSWCVDAASAKDTNRPELRHAMNLLAEDVADGIVVTKVDRLSRSVIDFATLMDTFSKSGKALVCIADSIDMMTPSGRFVAGILAGLAQLERELIGERTREALAELKRQGIQLGRPPSEVVDDLTEYGIRALHSDGLSQRAIAERLDLKHSTVRRVLTSSPSSSERAS